MFKAIVNNDLDTVSKNKNPEEFITFACEKGSYECLCMLLKNNPIIKEKWLESAILNKDDRVFRCLYEKMDKSISIPNLINKALYKNLDIFHFLTIRNRDYIGYAIQLLSLEGHLTLIKSLFISYSDEISNENVEDAINSASNNGHFEIIKYFYRLGYRGTSLAIDIALKYNRLDIANWLRYNGVREIINKDIENNEEDEIFMEVLKDMSKKVETITI